MRDVSNLSPGFASVGAVLVLALSSGVLQAQVEPRADATKAVTISEIQFDQPVAVIDAAYALTGGRLLVVADPRSPEPGVFLVAAGGEARRIGHVGDGPGEYRRIDAVAVDGDSVRLFDRANHRVTSLNVHTGTGRTWQVNQEARRSDCTPLVVLGEGILCQQGDRTADRRTILRQHLRWVPRPATPDSASTLLTIEMDSTRFLKMKGGLVALNRHLAWTPRYAQSPSLRMFAVLRQIRTGSIDSISVEQTNLPSGVRRQWAMVDVATLPTPAERAALIDHEIDAIREGAQLAGRPDEAPDRRAVERAFALPERLPVYKGIHVGDDGCVWLQRASAEVSARDRPVYDVHDFSGRRLATIEVRDRVRLSGVSCLGAVAVVFGRDSGPAIVRIALASQ